MRARTDGDCNDELHGRGVREEGGAGDENKGQRGDAGEYRPVAAVGWALLLAGGFEGALEGGDGRVGGFLCDAGVEGIAGAS